MEDWRALAAAQHGVVRRAAGPLAKNAAARGLRRGELVRRGRHALVVAGGVETPEQRLWLAVCEVGLPAVVSGLAALWLHGVPVPEVPERPEVLVPRHRTDRHTGAARVRRVVARAMARTRVVRGLRVASVPVALRRASREVDGATLVTCVEHVLRLRLATTGQLWRALGHGLVGARALRDALVVADPDSHSTWERRLAALIRRAGLPRPRRQARLGAMGATYWVDFLYDRHGLAVEVDGFAAHARPESYAYGLRRTRRLRVAHGVDVLAYAPVEVRDRPVEVVLEIAAALRQRGAAVPPSTVLRARIS